MDEVKALILAMTDQAIREWNDGSEEPMFPVTPEDCKTAANMIWNAAANAMAYGFWKGIEAGRKDPKGGLEK